jgi:hypothetical protein
VEHDTIMGMVVNEREWMTRLLDMMIEHVHCSRMTQSSNDCQIMKITRWKNPIKTPHHDWPIPLSSFTSLRRIIDAWYISYYDESLDIFFTNLGKEGSGPMCGSFDVKFNEPKEGKLNGLFMFKEYEKNLKNTPYTYLWMFLELEVCARRCF